MRFANIWVTKEGMRGEGEFEKNWNFRIIKKILKYFYFNVPRQPVSQRNKPMKLKKVPSTWWILKKKWHEKWQGWSVILVHLIKK